MEKKKKIEKTEEKVVARVSILFALNRKPFTNTQTQYANWGGEAEIVVVYVTRGDLSLPVSEPFVRFDGRKFKLLCVDDGYNGKLVNLEIQEIIDCPHCSHEHLGCHQTLYTDYLTTGGMADEKLKMPSDMAPKNWATDYRVHFPK